MQLKIFNEEYLKSELEIGKIHRSDKFVILFIKEGCISIKYNLSKYEIKKNSVLFVIPNSVYEFSYFSPDLKVTGLPFSRQFLNENGIHTSTSQVMETFASGFQPYYEISESEFSIFLNLLKVIGETTSGDSSVSFFNEKIRYGNLVLFYEGISIYKKYNADHKVKLNRPQELSIDFLRILSSNFRVERSVQFYAEHLFVTPRHLSQTLKQLTGKTAGEFIDRAVIVEAKILLRNPASNIGQVADALHFSDQFFFAKFFKKHTGQTPTQYRS